MADVYSVEEIRTIVSDVARQYGVKKAALFGSYSYGTPDAMSDIDLVIDKGAIRGLIRFNSFVDSLQTRLHKPVDVITYASLENSLIKDTVKNEVVLYEQS